MSLGAAGDPREFYAARLDEGPPTFTIAGRVANAPQPVPLQFSPQDRVAVAHKLIEAVGDAFEEHRQQVDADAFDKRSGRRRLEPDDRKAEAQAEVDKIRDGLVPQRDAAAETKAQRDWARAERALESAKTDNERAMMAQLMLQQTRSQAEFATLVEEVGPYLKAHDLKTDWLEETIAARTPALGEARQQLSQVERDLITTRFNAEQQRRML